MANFHVNGKQWIESPTTLDILMGKGKDCFNHEGNRRFRALIGACSQKYHGCKGRNGKRLVVSCVSDFLDQENSRFLKFDKNRKMWFVANPKEAKEKIGHAIRDNINFRIGISLRNMGQEESKEVSYETVQSILSRKTSDVGAELFQDDVSKLEAMLQTCFESDDMAIAKPTTKVQQGMMKRVKRANSASEAVNPSNLKNYPSAEISAIPSNPEAVAHSESTTSHDYIYLTKSISIESSSSASTTPSPTLQPMSDHYDRKPPPTRSSPSPGKVKSKKGNARVPVKKRYRGSSSEPLRPKASPTTEVTQSSSQDQLLNTISRHSELPPPPPQLLPRSSDENDISTTPAIPSGESSQPDTPRRAFMNEVIGILSTMKQGSTSRQS